MIKTTEEYNANTSGEEEKPRLRKQNFALAKTFTICVAVIQLIVAIYLILVLIMKSFLGIEKLSNPLIWCSIGSFYFISVIVMLCSFYKYLGNFTSVQDAQRYVKGMIISLISILGSVVLLYFGDLSQVYASCIYLIIIISFVAFIISQAQIVEELEYPYDDYVGGLESLGKWMKNHGRRRRRRSKYVIPVVLSLIGAFVLFSIFRKAERYADEYGFGRDTD